MKLSVNERVKKHNKTKKGLVTKIYADQRKRSKNRGHRMPEYSNLDLRDWLFSQVLFHELHAEWEHSGYDKSLIPSVDRKNDDIHYCMNNIQLMTWGENNKKGYADTRSGKLIHGNKPQRAVSKYNKEGDFISNYVSMKDASRKTGVSQGDISKVCNNKRNHAGGFVWRYTK